MKRGKFGQTNTKNVSGGQAVVNSESLPCNQQEFQEFRTEKVEGRELSEA